MRPRLIAALLALLALAVASAPADARKPRKAKRLTAFASCNQLVEYAGRHVPAAPPTAPRPIFPGREEAPAAPGAPLPATGSPDAGDDGGGDDVSGTNNQEAGVHEPDTVKTDGRTLFVLNRQLAPRRRRDHRRAGARRHDRVQGVPPRLDAAARRHACSCSAPARRARG